jgi:hypothetical protein
MAAEPQVLLHLPCDVCDGTGRVEWNPGGSGFVLGDSTKPCVHCGERGYFQHSVPLSDFKRLLDSV